MLIGFIFYWSCVDYWAATFNKRTTRQTTQKNDYKYVLRIKKQYEYTSRGQKWRGVWNKKTNAGYKNRDKMLKKNKEICCCEKTLIS